MIFSVSNPEYFSLADAVCTVEDSQGRVPVDKNIVKKLVAYLEAEKYFNLGTVCVVLLPVEDGLLLIRRNRKSDPGFGMVALPGGFQKGAKAQNMWDAAVEEVLEETGIVITRDQLSLFDGDTDEYEHNVLFFKHHGLDGLSAGLNQRKVRAPQGKVPGNTWEAQAYGKCHRKYTASIGKGEMVR